MESVLQIISALLLLIGSFLCISGGIGLLRFPDFFSRMHAAGVTDTLATTMIILGLVLIESDLIVDIKLFIILLMTLFISPTASHALAHTALRNKQALEGKQRTDEEVSSSNS